MSTANELPLDDTRYTMMPKIDICKHCRGVIKYAVMREGSHRKGVATMGDQFHSCAKCATRHFELKHPKRAQVLRHNLAHWRVPAQ